MSGIMDNEESSSWLLDGSLSYSGQLLSDSIARHRIGSVDDVRVDGREPQDVANFFERPLVVIGKGIIIRPME